ncbi:hypothetical protein H8K35_04840 [Undibacterium sp. LX40W]|uniref:Glycosyl hydrolase family 32 N-terminal domain-containing protein n=1 Tax=Undibacterium nitidum TaxID=2762298 RepID=A0A923HJM9_9BURK|nr:MULTISPECIES: hypothetical protein [Undibacterium]MBC3880287.1 hypothetical protein [Undibacterium nitidum]MBC3890977.1 hypothetical protein [Undibacterium sp. LX40W]
MSRTFVWDKKGVIFRAEEHLPWAKSHTQMPTIDVSCKDELQVFFSARDQNSRSQIGRFSVDKNNLQKIISVQGQPVLGLGTLGSFDDCGVMPTAVLTHQGTKYLYYIGWNVRNTIPYHNSIGLAISEDDGASYRRLFNGPVMDRSHDEPFFCATACIQIENGIWRNWYLSCTEWRMVNGKAEPRYHLKYAESDDGIHWRRYGQVAIDFKDDEEGAVARASVLKRGNTYQMWFCYRKLVNYSSDRNASYRIGYAESTDGIQWLRMDEMAGIALSEEGWDSFMQAYPDVFSHLDQTYMLYNGNGFGQTGIGIARLCHLSNSECP